MLGRMMEDSMNKELNTISVENISAKSRLVALLLCIFFSWLGVHRFYVGKIGSGIAMILIGWLTFGIWHLIHLVVLLTGNFKDNEGKVVRKWIDDSSL